MNLNEDFIDSSLKFNGNFLKLKVDTVKLPNNKKSTRELIEHPGAACILALDENDNVFIVKQYRYPISKIMYEIPAGKIDKNEDPIQCAYREFEEETGYKATQLKLLGIMHPASAYTTEVIYIYLALGTSKGEVNLDKDEFLKFEKIHISKVRNMILNNEITDAKTQIAVMKYLLGRD